ncbi:MAG: T9SS type A sorting domain-containing protein [Bacteroidota bacterium]
MKTLTLFGLISLISSLLMAQAPYAGGEGDGYARVLVQQTPVSIQEQLPAGWTIGPNPIKAEAFLRLSWPITPNETRILIHDVKGRILLHQSISPQSTEHRLKLPSSLSGIYVLEIRRGDLFIHQKIQVHAQ